MNLSLPLRQTKGVLAAARNVGSHLTWAASRLDPNHFVGDMTLKSITFLLGTLLLATSNTTDAAVLRFQTVVASANVSLDGIGESDQGSTLVEAVDPDGSTFALADPNSGEIKVRALASEDGRLSASARGSIRFTFRAEGGGDTFPRGRL